MSRKFSMDGDISKLPVWAQNRIKHLEGVVAERDERIAVLSEGPDDSDTFTDPYRTMPRFLGKGTLIRFGTIDYSGAVFDVQLKDGELHVRAGGKLNDQMVIVPEVSNAFTVGFRPRP